MPEGILRYSKQSLTDLLKWQRVWVRKKFPKGELKKEVVTWEVPNTPFTIEGLLWQISEVYHWVRVGILEMRKSNGTQIGYPKFESGSDSVEERIEQFLEMNRALQKKVEDLSDEELNSMITHMGPSGEQTVPLGYVVAQDVFITTGTLYNISFIHGLKRRMEGEKQKWPPY
ncbi:MAG: hypothetical protein ACXACA_01320 [Candidatus Ranarchaeia archaeon]|jgi:hypothetical protein